jgi:hypothetical protein
MCSGFLAKEFWLWSIIRLPSLTEWMIHPEIGEVVVLKIEVIEIIASGLNFFALEYSDQLWLRFFESD